MDLHEGRGRKRTLVVSGTHGEPVDLVMPERNLCYAILERAVLDLFGKRVTSWQATGVHREAYRWLFLPSEKLTPLFTFEEVCENIDVEPSEVRSIIWNAWREGEDLCPAGKGRPDGFWRVRG